MLATNESCSGTLVAQRLGQSNASNDMPASDHPGRVGAKNKVHNRIDYRLQFSRANPA